MKKLLQIDEGKIIIGGDFNIRIGEKCKNYNLGNIIGENKKVSKDKTVSNGSRRMVDFIEDKSWIVLNGRARGGEEGEFTFFGYRGNSVIDFVIVNDKMRDSVKGFRTEERVDSNHAPACAMVSWGKEKSSNQDNNARKVVE